MSFCLSDLKTYYTWGLCILQPVRRRVLSIQESLWIAGERSLWRFGSLPWRLTRVIGRGLCVLSSRGIRWRRGLLSWISASLTRRTVVTTTGTGPTNPVSSTSDWFYPLTPFNLSLSSWSHCMFVIPVWLHCLTVIVDWRHTIFHPDPYYQAAISLCTFTLLHTWLWLACCSLSSAAYQLGHFYCLSSKLPCFEDFYKNRLFTPL